MDGYSLPKVTAPNSISPGHQSPNLSIIEPLWSALEKKVEDQYLPLFSLPKLVPASQVECMVAALTFSRIVEKNPGKFKIDNKELSSRRNFIDQTRDEVKTMKDKMNISRGRDRDRTARQPLLENSPVRVPSTHGTTKYSKLENELDSPNRQFLDDTLQQQNHMLRSQDEQLDIISDSVGTLKTVSRQIGNELDEQAVMLDEFGNEMENTDSKLDSTMKRVAKVFHISNDRRQWIAIGVLSGIMVIVIILFIFT